MRKKKSSFLDKVLGRIGDLDQEGLQTVVHRLAGERDFLETLFDSIEDGLVVVDERGRITYFNESAERMIGLKPDADGELITKYFRQLDWDQLMGIDAAGGRRVVRREFEVKYPRERFISMYAAPLDGAAVGRAGFTLILHDATEARAAEFEAIESERIHALTLLAASVAHEIGNPLNALHIHLQLMEREVRKLRRLSRDSDDPRPSVEASGGRLAGYLDVAKGEIARLDYIVTQFLQAIRPTKPKFESASLNQVVGDTLELLAPELENRGLAVRENLKQGLPTAEFDPAQMKQVLVNLVKNAMQATSSGGEMRLETGAEAEAVWVSVSDTGGGIPREKLNRVFEPFFTTKQKGTGLGLMIVQRIIREHGGRVDVESRAGEGSTFRIWLPVGDRRPRLLESSATEKSE